MRKIELCKLKNLNIYEKIFNQLRMDISRVKISIRQIVKKKYGINLHKRNIVSIIIPRFEEHFNKVFNVWGQFVNKKYLHL